MDSAPPEQQLS